MRRSLGKLRLLGTLMGLAAAPLALNAATMEIGSTVVNSGADATVPVRVDADTATVVSSIDEVIGQVQMQAPAPANLDFESLVVDTDWQGVVRFRDSGGVQVDIDYIVDANPLTHTITPSIAFLPTIERVEFELVRSVGTTSADDVIMDITFSSVLAPVSVNPIGWNLGFANEMRGDGGTTEPFSIGPLAGLVAISAPVCEYAVGADDATTIPSTPAADPADTDPDSRVTGREIGPAGGAFGGIALAGNVSCGFAIDFDSPEVTFPNGDDNCAAFSPALAANEVPWPSVSPFVTTNGDGTVLVADDCTDFIGGGTGSVLNLVFNAPPYFGSVDRSVWLRIGNGGANDAWVYLLQTGCSYTDPTTTVNIDCAGLENGPVFPAACPAATDMVAGSFGLTSDTGCEWNVTVGDCAGNPPVDWLVIDGGPVYSGTDTVNFLACANNGPARTGTIRVEDGQGNCYDVTVEQQSGCDVVGYNPASELVVGTGATGLTVDVEVTDPGCVPNFTSPDPWVSNISAGTVVDQSGVGTGPFVITVTYDVAPNAGPARSTTIDADLGLTCNMPASFPIDQECGCILLVNPEITNPAIEEGGGAGAFSITDEGCTYTVAADQPWVTVGAGPFGPAGSPGAPGDTLINFTVDPNLGSPRTAVITITPVECGEAVTFTVCQDGDCVVSVTPNEIVVPSTYTQSSFDVLAPAPADFESAYYAYTGNAAPIPNGDGVPFTFYPGEPALTSINVPDEGFILDIKVRLEIEHDRPSDVSVSLLHVPTGKIVELVDRIGVTTGDDFDFGCDGSFGTLIDCTLADDGDELVEFACPAIRNFDDPAFVPNTPLSTFDGIPMRGEWVLVVTDSVDPAAAVPVMPGAGEVSAWSMEIDYQPIGCSWEIVGPAVDGNGDPLNGNGIPNWIKLTNLEPLNANGVQRYIGAGSKHITFDVLPTPSELSRSIDLRVIPFVSAIGGDCADVLFDEASLLTITQWADCLYTVDPKKTVPCLGAAASSGNEFTIQTNQGQGVGSSVVKSGTVQCLDASSDTQVGIVDLFETSPLATVTEAAITVVFEKRSVDTDSNSDGSFCDEVDDGFNIFPNEINFVLESPTGTQIELIPVGYFDDTPTPNVGQVTYTFVPGAAILPGAGANLAPSGVYAPPVDDLATLVGENAYGTWSLLSSDDAGTDPLIVSEWTLSLEVEQPLGPLNSCTWRLDDITSWATVTSISYPDWPLNPPAGEPGHDPNIRVNPVLFGQPGFPADADNFQGEGTAVVTYDVAENPTPSSREGWIEIGTESGLYKHEICQSAEPCVYTVDPPLFSPTAEAGNSSFRINTGDLCCWRVWENVDWIEITSFPQGQGTDTVEYDYDSNIGPGRRSWIYVTDCNDNIVARHEVSQAPGCDLQIDSFLSVFPSVGGPDSFNVSIGTGCLWTASTTDAWISVINTTGNGNGIVNFTVAPNVGPARSGSIEVDWNGDIRTHFVQQSSGCVLSTSTPGPFAVVADGDVVNVEVDGVTVDCPYNAFVNDAPATNLPYSWIHITSGASSTVADTVEVTLDPNPGPARTGSIRIVGDNNVLTIVFNQANGCTLEALVDGNGDATDSFNQAGGTGEFLVTLADSFGGNLGAGEEAACAWTAVSDNPSWITILEGNNGVGEDSVVFSVAPYFGGGTRNGTITVTGANNQLVYSIEQTDECAPVVTETTAAYNHSAQSGSFELTGMALTCPWTASIAYTDGSGWLSIQSGQDGVGNGLVTYEVAGYFSAPTSATTREAVVTITAQNGLTATHTITQTPDCDLVALSPDAIAFNHEGGAGEFEIELASLSTVDCPWRVEVSEAWVNIQSVANGTGNGHIGYDVEPFYFGSAPDFNRTATIRVYLDNGDELIHTITQVDECTPLASPDTASFNHSAQSGGFVLSGMELTCPWTATITYNPVPAGNEPEWLSLTTGQEGVGDGLLTYDVAAYFDDAPPATPRTATITVTSTNGRTTTHVITQNADCDLIQLVDVDGFGAFVGGNNGTRFNHEGGAGQFNVVMAALGTVDCPWTVATSAAWVNIQSGIDGIGNGLVSFDVEEFYGAAASRSAVITISLDNGDSLTYTVLQENECVPVITPTSLAYNHSEQTGSFELTGMFLTCPWEADIIYTSGDPGWLTLSSGNDGTGNQLVTYEIGAYFSDPALGQPQPPIPTRTAVVRITSRTRELIAEHTITQSDDCNLLPLVPASKTFYQAGGFGSFQVPFASGGTVDCVFAIAVNATDLVDGTDWISIQTGFDGAGNSIVTYEVEPFFNSCPDEFERTGTIVLTLPNGDSETHTVTQVDNCVPGVSPEGYTFQSNSECRTFDVFFGNDPDGEYDCHWIARIRYEGQTLGAACDACTEVIGEPDPEINEPWVWLVEGSTEGHGDGSVTYCVDDYVNYIIPQRIAYIDIIADNCRVATHQITQIDPCQFCLTAFDEESDPDCVDLASFTNAEALLNYGIETGTPNDYSVDPPTGTEDDFLPCNVEFWYDHHGRLTGPVTDCNDDNTGTGSFRIAFETVTPFEECSWTAIVIQGEQWITLVEGSTGFGDGQVFFEIDPNVVDGPDVARQGIVLVTASNGQTQIAVINQAEGFYPLDQFELAAPALYDDYGFNANTLVIGYTQLGSPSITTDNAGTSGAFVLFDTKSNRTVRVDPNIQTDARGMVVGFADVAVYDSSDKGYSSFLGEFELPITGRFNFSRTAVREVNTPDNNYNGFTTAKYNNAFSLTGKDPLRGTFNAKGAEKFTVVPPALNDFTGFQTSTKATSKLDGASAKASGHSVVNNWIPTTASLAISKSSLTGTPQLNSYTSDLLLLDSNYNVLGEQNGGATAMKTLFVRERGEKAGNYSWTGQIGRSANNKFTTKGQLQLTFEQVSAEGFWLDRPDTLGELFEILNSPAPGRKNPGAIRGVTVFPTSVSFSNSQVNIRTTEKWNKNLVLNPVVTTPPPTPQP